MQSFGILNKENKVKKLDIFCNVIDNYGDAGVCLHLARTLSEHLVIRLFCNNMAVIKQIMTKEDELNLNLQIISWEQPLTTYQNPDFVICAFSCRLDQIVIDKLKQEQTVVINLEYLSAEQWVEDCHGLPSFSDQLNTYFFFPGFTQKTGGLNVDQHFKQLCSEHVQNLITKEQVLNQSATSQIRKINIFSYENPAVKDFISGLEQDTSLNEITLFSDLAINNVNKLYQLNLNNQAEQGAHINDHICFKTSPMISQAEFDQYLINADINLVRGEDSIIRAMHTGNPFLWQIYIQEDNVHITKLQSFLDVMGRVLTQIYQEQQKSEPSYTDYIKLPDNYQEEFKYLEQCMLAYNEGSNVKFEQNFKVSDFVNRTHKLFIAYAQYLNQQETLAERLLAFLAKFN